MPAATVLQRKFVNQLGPKYARKPRVTTGMAVRSRRILHDTLVTHGLDAERISGSLSRQPWVAKTAQVFENNPKGFLSALEKIITSTMNLHNMIPPDSNDLSAYINLSHVS